MAKRYGIDLGTTYSCIAHVDEYGRPSVLPNKESRLTTPSVVYFESDTSIVVGQRAKEVGKIYPDRVFAFVKREIGNPNPLIVHAGKPYTAVDISALVLRKVVEDAEACVADKIKDVVITVPAYFGVTEIEATRQAGIIAGLNVHSLIPEPTAAALAYGMTEEKDQVVLVYDLGGGTFDITMIEVKKSAIKVICTGGDRKLGGFLWDEALAGFFAQQFSQETGIEPDRLLEDAETYQELMNMAEEKKITLSSAESAVAAVRYDVKRAKVELSRGKFQELTADLLARTHAFTDELLEVGKAKGYPTVDRILLVGGSTFMPQVVDSMRAKFGVEVRHLDPNLIVAKGAALFGFKTLVDEEIAKTIIRRADEGDAAAKSAVGKDGKSINLERVPVGVFDEVGIEVGGIPGPVVEAMGKTTVTNVTSKSFGVKVVDNRGAEKVCNLIMIDDQVPRKRTWQFETAEEQMTGALIVCMENSERTGPEQLIAFDDTQQRIGETQLEFERPLAKGSPLEITYSLAQDGTLAVHGKDLTTGREIHAEFKTERILSEEQLEEAKKKIGNLTVS